MSIRPDRKAPKLKSRVLAPEASATLLHYSL